MSHSVFKDYDDELPGGGETADANLIVFLHKDGDVTVDQSALKDFVVNANTEKKTTVSVIRVGSPTPSMESSNTSSNEANSSDDDNEEQSENTDDDDEVNEDGESDAKRKSRSKKRKNAKPRIALTVENFFNPDEANKFAEEIMTKAGFTDRRQLKVDYEHLRFVVSNDHCYTTRTLGDRDGKLKDGAQKAVKESAKTPANSGLKSLVGAKKSAVRTKTKAKPVSEDEGNSGQDDEADDSDIGEEEEESGSDFSDTTPSESDNDRDSDLDFSVNDRSMSKKISKKKKKRAMAKKRAEKEKLKKRRSGAVDTNSTANDTPDDSSGRKKAGRPSVVPTVKKTPTIKSPAESPQLASGSGKISKLPVSKVIKQVARDKQISTLKDDKEPLVVLRRHPVPVAQPIATTSKTASVNSTITSQTVPDAGKIIAKVVSKDKKPSAIVADPMVLFASPDIIKNVNKDSSRITKVYTNTSFANRQFVQTPQRMTTATLSASAGLGGGFVQIGPNQIIRGRQSLPTQISVRVHSTAAPNIVKLESEQEKQLELIDSIVKQEMALSDEEQRSRHTDVVTTAKVVTPSRPPKILNQTFVQTAIPNIVKMLESPAENHLITSSTITTVTTQPPVHQSMAQQQQHHLRNQPNVILNSTLAMPVSTATELHFTTNITNDTPFIDEDLLESLTNPVEPLSEDLLAHVAKLAEDKNLQEIIDTQVLGVSRPVTTTAQIVKLPTAMPTVLVNVPAVAQKPAAEKESSFFKLAMEREAQKAALAQATAARVAGPVQILRNGRVITLPQIEAPTTRSKRRAGSGSTTPNQSGEKTPLSSAGSTRETTPTAVASGRKLSSGSDVDAAAARAKGAKGVNKRTSTDSNASKRLSVSSATAIIAQSDDCDDYDEDYTNNSEDDPTRLWCICRQPHNNRFMICCDKCEDWFHGKCVNITKSMGNDMEARKIEWVCPNCVKKQQPSVKDIFSKISKISSPDVSPTVPASSPKIKCIQCIKPRRQDSIYCSDECIIRHMASAKPDDIIPATSISRVSSDAKRKSLEIAGTTPQPIKMIKTNQPGAKGKILVYDHAKKRYVDKHDASSTVVKPAVIAEAFKAKSNQMKQLKLEMNKGGRSPTATQSQSNMLQTTLKFDGGKNIMVVNPVTGAVKSSPGQLQLKTTPKLTKTPQNVHLRPGTTPSPTTPKNRATPMAKNHLADNQKNATPRSSDKGAGLLKEKLMTRTAKITDANAPKLTEDEIVKFAEDTVKELLATFGHETNIKYRNKYRSLVFNVGHEKNLTLFQKISSKVITPAQLVGMSSEQMASQELAKWRENENKHQLEMIKKSELDLLACAKSYVLKSHKGEEVIEDHSDRLTLPSTSLEDVVPLLNNSTVSSTSEAAILQTIANTTPIKDNRIEKLLSVDSTSNKSSDSSSSKKKDHNRSRSRSRDHSRHHDSSKKSSKHKRKRSRDRRSRSRSRSRDRKDKERHREGHNRDRDRDRRDKSRHDKSKHEHSSTSSSITKERKSTKDAAKESLATKGKHPVQKDEDYNLIDKILEAQSTIDRIVHPSRAKEETKKETAPKMASDSKVAGSSGRIQSNPSIESDQEPTSTVTIATPDHSGPSSPNVIDNRSIWSGTINMIDVATFQISTIPFSGDSSNIEKDFPKELDVVGRIIPETVWDYIDKVKRTKEIIMVRFQPHSDEDDIAYNKFLQYLDSRKRLGVIKSSSPVVKDFYILPLLSYKSLPSVLLPINGPGLDSNRADMLVGIIVKTTPLNVLKRPQPPFVPRLSQILNKVKPSESSLGISLPSSSMPELIPSLLSKGQLDPYIPGDDDEPYSPGGSDDDNLPPLGISGIIAPVVDDALKLEMDEINRQIEMNRKEIELLNTAKLDEPYSPSRPVSPSPSGSSMIPGLGNITNISIPSDLADILKSISGASMTGVDAMPTEEYAPTHPIMHTGDYIPGLSASPPTVSAPSKLARMTDEELLRMVPDDSLIDIAPSPAKKTKFDVEPLPPGIDEEEYVP